MNILKSQRMTLLLSVVTIAGCSAMETSPQYGAGNQASGNERYCQSVAQYEAEQVRRQNVAGESVSAVAGAAVGGIVGRNLEQDRTIEGAAIGALGGASAAYIANKDKMRSAYDTAYRRCMDQR